jgi:hypothetical protein
VHGQDEGNESEWGDAFGLDEKWLEDDKSDEIEVRLYLFFHRICCGL